MKNIKLSQMQYTRPDKDQVIAQLNNFRQQFEQCTTAQQFYEVHKQYKAFISDVETNYTLCFIRNSLNSKDEFYSKEQEYWDEVMPEISAKLADTNKCYVNAPFRSELLKYFPEVLFANLEMAIKANDPINIEHKKQVNKLVTEYSRLVSNLTVDFDGQTMPLSTLRKYLTDADRNVRCSAMQVYGEAIEANKATLDSIYDKMVQLRTAMGRNLGYESYSPLGYLSMQRNSYGKEDVAKFRQNVLKYIVPLCCDIYKRADKMLGITDRKLYDENIFTDKEPKPVGSAEQIFANGSKMYHEMSKETGALFDRMVKCEAFDYISREGKWGGGYCTGISKYKLPFILSNFNGSAGDIEVLTHEFGHAYEASKEFDNEIALLTSYSMETAEVHSTSMEYLTYPWMQLFFGDATQDYIKYHLSSGIVFLPYGTIVDYFQQLCYDNPDMTPEERNKLYLELEHRFRPWIDTEGVTAFSEGRWWQKQSHIYEEPFYYIDYCLAQVTALQFLAMSMQDHSKAMDTYRQFINCGGNYTFLQIIQKCGLQSPFEESTFVNITSVLRKLLEL